MNTYQKLGARFKKVRSVRQVAVHPETFQSPALLKEQVSLFQLIARSLCALLHQFKSQVPSFHALARSLRKVPGRGVRLGSQIFISLRMNRLQASAFSLCMSLQEESCPGIVPGVVMVAMNDGA